MTHSRWTAVTAVASLAAILTGCVCPCGQKVASLGDQHSVARVVASAGRRPSHATIQRAQNSSARPNETAAGTDHYRYPMAVSGQTSPPADALAAASTAPQTTISRTTISPAPYGSTNFGQAKTNPPTKPRSASTPPTANSSSSINGQTSAQTAETNSYGGTSGSSGISSTAAAPAGTVYETTGGYSSGAEFSNNRVVPAQFTESLPPPPSAFGPGGTNLGVPPGGILGVPGSDPAALVGIPTPMTDVIVNVQETQTGRLMIGAGINSDAGVTGQITIDEKNFDWRRYPRSFDDIVNGTAWRGDGQGFRVEVLPGSVVQRYMVQFTEPYLLDTRVSFNMSAYMFDRRYFDWDEQRLGGRLGLGYRFTPDLSINTSLRTEHVQITNPRVPLGVAPSLDAVLGGSDLYSGRIALVHDTRDIPFAPTQGHYLELAYEQMFGTFDYSRGSVDVRRYFLITERPDGSGRHTLGFSSRVGISGDETPIFENYFAGGYSTLRGFDFRDASPLSGSVRVGGRLQLLSSVEYLFPVTADDMLKGVVFCDYGTIEENIKIEGGDYRVALGAGLRITVPAMGPAPIAFDFAVPVARETGDEIRNFSFYIGVAR